MKKSLQFLFSLSILALAAVSAYAQPPGGGRMAMMNPEQRAERQATMMQDTLGLSDELTADVKEVLGIYAKKMQEARAEANGDWEAMRSTMQKMRQEQNEELEAILGEEQWAKWEAITAERMQQRGQRGRGNRQGPEKKKDKKKDTKTE